MENRFVVPHERFETIEEVFAYADQTMDNFKNSGVALSTPHEALLALFTMNEAFCQLSKICGMHLKRARFHIEQKG